jgi:hypothetical protein
MWDSSQGIFVTWYRISALFKEILKHSLLKGHFNEINILFCLKGILKILSILYASVLTVFKQLVWVFRATSGGFKCLRKPGTEGRRYLRIGMLRGSRAVHN